jgi:gliding motility-associated-like protein
MKKITFSFFMFILPFLSFAQINEGFEGATFPPVTPGNWIVLDNGVGTTVNWTETTDLTRVYAGSKAAIIDRENIGAGNTSQDWLISPQITIPANGQLKFFTRQTLIGNNGSTYEIRVSTNASQTNQASYTTVQAWTETSLNATYNVYEEKSVSLSAYAGQQVYIAFVKVNTQATGTISGDRWLIDEVKVIQQCLDPTALSVGTVTPTTANLAWINNGSATAWEVEVLPSANNPTGVGVTASTNPFTATGLAPGTSYKFYVRANCGGGNYSQWVGPFNFLTTPAGSICSTPITIASLPYSHTANTNTYGDEVDTPQGAACAGGAVNYMQGAEVFYSFTPTFTGNISISMTTSAVSSSLFVYNGCSNVGVSCLAGVADTTANPRNIPTLAVTAGQTYVIVISSSTTPTAGIPYTLVIQQVTCTPPASLSAANIGTTTADLSWSNPTAATSWQVAVQPAGSSIPSGPGITANTNTNFTVTGLTAATAYQYWVRSDCGGGLFSAWAGPFLFNTAICNAVDRCNYTFRLTDSFGDGWDSASNPGRMLVKQNGVTVATLTMPSGSSLDVSVALCQTLPFELYWTAGGASPSEIGIAVINNFGQTLYTKAAGAGSVNATTPLYTTAFNCATPACLPPTALTVTAITTNGATLGWNGAGATAWDVYVVTNGSPAPTGVTVPSYSGVTTNPFVVTGLLPLTQYQFYVRVVCSGTSKSTWAGPIAFTTLPTCPQPTNLTVSAINMTSANLGWTEAGSATQWEVFVQAPGAGVPTGSGTLVTTNPYTVTGLTSGTNYEFYVRAVCSTTDKSTWAGPKTFATTICAPANQCNYTFRLTDSFGDGWNGALMEVRQNGVVVATLGSTFTTGAGPVNITVPICHGIPFDLYWTVGGLYSGEVGISIIEPLGSTTIFNKPAGTGSVSTTNPLYTDIGQCFPPTCSKPTNLTATAITQTTALLGWTQPATPGTATSWQIIVQPAILGYPTGPGTVTTANPYTATGLTPGTAYEFYVRANCGNTDGLSIWSGPFAFFTPVSNNDCSNAITVPVNQDSNCAQTTNGTFIGATASTPATNPVCTGTADDDIWYKFTATSTTHYISFLNVIGSTTNIGFAIYGGVSCGALTQLYCDPNYGTGVQGRIIKNLTIGNTYYIRAYTEIATPNQTTTFNLCVGTPSTVDTATATCSNPSSPFIFSNFYNVPSDGAVASLQQTPNPRYYFMTILQSGNLQFQISQNTSYDAAGNPTGTPLDVDFATWGPFTSNVAAVGNLSPGCLTAGSCQNNTTAPVGYYPFPGTNIIDSSYSANSVETVTINNAIAGQVYVFLITNFNGAPGFIRFDQTNIGVPGSGLTDCSIVCSVDLGPDQNLCGVTTTLLDSHLSNATATFVWKRNGVVISGATASTYTATQSGIYTCIGSCGPNSVQDTMILNFGPSVVIPDQPAYELCDDSSNDGIATFDLATLTPLVTAGLNGAYTYTVSYYYTEADALAGNSNTINPAVPYIGASQTIYIRVVANGSPACNTVVAQSLVVKKQPLASIASDDADNTICSNTTALITVTPTNFLVGDATYSWTLNGVTITGATTNQITPTATGTYECTITLNGCTTTRSLLFTINAQPVATIASSDVDNTICSNETAIITVTPANFLVGDATYSWTLNGVLIPGAITNQVTATATGTYECTVTLNGCTTTLSLLFTINPLPIATIASNDADNTICSNEIAIITVTPTNFLVGNATYSWTLNGVLIAAATTNQVTPTATGTYECTVNLNGCTTTVSLLFTINTLPDYNLIGTNLVKCAKEQAILTVSPLNFSVTNPSITYTWKLGSTVLPFITSSISVSDYGVYEVTVNNLGCVTTKQIEVKLDTTDIPINTTGECSGTNFIITAQPINNSYDPQFVTYQWYNDNQSSLISGATQNTLNVTNYANLNNIQPSNFPITFEVQITTIPDGCVDTQKFVVETGFCTIQKGISPNGDGQNDTFDLRGLGVKKLSIFNRYGSKVYSLDNYTNQWYGQSESGQELPDGTYYFVIEQNNGETKSGWIYINK